MERPIVLEEVPSDDEWITEREEPVLPTDGAWLAAFDRASRRYAREAARNEDESTDGEANYENVEVHALSDNEVAGTYITSNEGELDEFDAVVRDDIDTTGTGTSGGIEAEYESDDDFE